MANKKIIFFDIDRTIYDPDTRSIPLSTKEALKKLHDNPDVEIAIATGRAFYMLHIIDEIKEYINILNGVKCILNIFHLIPLAVRLGH